MLPLITVHRGPCLPQQACLPGTTELDSCGKRPADYSPQAREVACKRPGGSMHDDSSEMQNAPTQGTHDTQPAEPDLQASRLACNRLMSTLMFCASHWVGCILMKPLWSNRLVVTVKNLVVACIKLAHPCLSYNRYTP